MNGKKLKSFAEICALIHDVGHGPFSHFVEPFLEWTTGEKRRNEDIGKDVVLGAYEDIDKEFASKDAKSLKQTLEGLKKEIGFSLKDFANYITSDEEFTNYCDPNETYLFIRKLISSPIDMDRLDFLNRDAYFVGLKGGVDASSIIENLSLLKTKDGALDLVLDEIGIPHFENLLTSRDLMYAIVYHHPVNRWALGAVLRSAYRLNRDFHVPENIILRQTDSTLLAMLKEGDDYTRGVAQRIEERRPYNRVFELDFSWLNLINLPNKDEVKSFVGKLEDKPVGILKFEEDIRRKLAKYRQHSEEIDLIIDIPPPLKFVEADVAVKIKGENEPIPLSQVSDLAKYISERRRERRWILHVFTNASFGSVPYKKIIDEVKEIFSIPPDSHPYKRLPIEKTDARKTQ